MGVVLVWVGLRVSSGEGIEQWRRKAHKTDGLFDERSLRLTLPLIPVAIFDEN